MDVKTKKFELKSPFLRLTIEYDIDDPLVNLDAFSENGWSAVVKAVTRSSGVMDEEVDDAAKPKELRIEKDDRPATDGPTPKKGNSGGGKK